MIGLEILMTPFATWGLIFGFIALVVCITWIFNRVGATFRETSQENRYNGKR